MAPNKKQPAKTAAPSSASTTDTSSTTTKSSTSSAAVGDVVSYQIDEDGPTTSGIVVGRVDGAEYREAALLVAPLPDATTVPLDAVKG